MDVEFAAVLVIVLVVGAEDGGILVLVLGIAVDIVTA